MGTAFFQSALMVTLYCHTDRPGSQHYDLMLHSVTLSWQWAMTKVLTSEFESHDLPKQRRKSTRSAIPSVVCVYTYIQTPIYIYISLAYEWQHIHIDWVDQVLFIHDSTMTYCSTYSMIKTNKTDSKWRFTLARELSNAAGTWQVCLLLLYVLAAYKVISGRGSDKYHG